jgi:[acyl-carrier-protein] S-malonyltransferase
MPPGKIAFIFPGQGAQYSGMGHRLALTYPEARAVFDQADRALGFPISRICFEGPDEELRRTENTQPSILTVSAAAFRVLEERGVRPDFLAGHSLGEYSALVAGGALPFADAVRLVRSRGQYMQQAVPEGVGAMAAILGLAPELVAVACEAVREDQVVAPANFNSRVQVVVAGHRGAVERAIEEARRRGARRAQLLPVSAPFHCSLMLPAEERLGRDLDSLEFSPLEIPLVTNVDAGVVTDGEAARDGVRRQPSRPVLWLQTIELLLDQGVDTFIEVGPGKVLSGLVRSIEKSVTMLNAEDDASVARTIAALA